MREPLKIFIGWDSKEVVAYHTLCQSILEHASVPVSFTPLTQSVLRSCGLYSRERGPTESTEFSLTRFLVPYLCRYEGYALFLDCDMLVQRDITELWAHALADPGKAVYVCQHDYTPKQGRKHLGHVQTAYPRKNWSSLMLFDAGQCRNLTPDYVSTASGLELHRFHWAPVADGIGSLPLEWNWLLGEYRPKATAANLHWTNGGPWFDETKDADHADRWRAVRDRMLTAAKPQEA